MPAVSAIHRQWDLKLPITSLVSNRAGTWVAASMGDGSLRLLAAHDDTDYPKEVKLHQGISLSLQPDAVETHFLSGGDDGKVFSIDPAADTPIELAHHKNQWVDNVASSTDGNLRAYSFGKNVQMLNAKGEAHGAALTHPSSIGGLAFSPNGKRLAASHYNGVSLWWTNAKDAVPVKLEWKGSHLGTVWHPDGKILLTSLQENALHGWRMTDMNEMRMQGYASKIHSMSFTAKGKYLATSGAEQIICWPFFGGGPWGKTPLCIGGVDARLITSVSAHPKDELVAAGYNDGMIVMAPLDGRMEVLIHPPVQEKGAAVTGLAWNKEGDCLFASLENGYLMLFTIDSVQRAVTQAAT
ncbi:MAG TPA: WD40 repeat domain-containing protein [Alphaproteobacteria bacterium]|nr:WD40 repeat domain-containing protein [Alphaproteobacteria bacterium]